MLFIKILQIKKNNFGQKNSNNLVPVSKNIIYEHPVTKENVYFYVLKLDVHCRKK